MNTNGKSIASPETASSKLRYKTEGSERPRKIHADPFRNKKEYGVGTI